MKIVTKGLSETHNLAIEFIGDFLAHYSLPPAGGHTHHAPVFGLYGDLGSGKTAFVQGVAKALGIKHPITSPTFVIQKRYEIGESRKSKVESDSSTFNFNLFTFNSIVHIDAYRLNEGKDMTALRWEETLSDPGNIVFLEWPEIVESALPANLIPLKFRFIDENTREIELPEL